MNCEPHNDLHTEECIKGIAPCDGFRCSVCGTMLTGDLQGNPNPCMCHECADSYVGAAHKEMDAVRSSVNYSDPSEDVKSFWAHEADERTRIGNYPTCDECNEQHSQDVDCSDWTERLMTKKQHTETDCPMPWCEHCQCYHHTTAKHIKCQCEQPTCEICDRPVTRTGTIDITPVGCQTPEGNARVLQAQQEWDSATHELANYLKNVVDDIFYTDGDKFARAEMYSELQTLIGIREVKQEAFLRAVAGR